MKRRQQCEEMEMDQTSDTPSASLDERRAHHNALEKRRRDNIKENFNKLRDAVPSMKGKKVSRIQIITGATDYIVSSLERLEKRRQNINNINMHNAALMKQIAALSALYGVTDEQLDAEYAALMATPLPGETGESSRGRAPPAPKRGN